MKRFAVLVSTVGIAVAGCGSSGTKASTATTVATTVATTGGATTSASTAAAATATSAAAADVTTTAASSAPAGGIAVTEKEFSITLATPLTSGANTLAVTNGGSFPHELKLIKADSYDALTKAADGSVDESALTSDAVVAKMAKVAAGGTGTLSATLAPGKYVLICNLGTGASNHAAKGMHVDITIS